MPPKLKTPKAKAKPNTNKTVKQFANQVVHASANHALQGNNPQMALVFCMIAAEKDPKNLTNIKTLSEILLKKAKIKEEEFTIIKRFINGLLRKKQDLTDQENQILDLGFQLFVKFGNQLVNQDNYLQAQEVIIYALEFYKNRINNSEVFSNASTIICDAYNQLGRSQVFLKNYSEALKSFEVSLNNLNKIEKDKRSEEFYSLAFKTVRFILLTLVESNYPLDKEYLFNAVEEFLDQAMLHFDQQQPTTLLALKTMADNNKIEFQKKKSITDQQPVNSQETESKSLNRIKENEYKVLCPSPLSQSPDHQQQETVQPQTTCVKFHPRQKSPLVRPHRPTYTEPVRFNFKGRFDQHKQDMLQAMLRWAQPPNYESLLNQNLVYPEYKPG